MRVSEVFGARLPRTILLGSIAIGWAGVIVGATTEQQALVAVGAAVVAIGNFVVAKGLLETSTSFRALRNKVATHERTLQRTVAEVEDMGLRLQKLSDLEVRVQKLSGEDALLQAAIERLRSEATSLTVELARNHNDATNESADLVRAIDDLRARVANLAGSHDTTRSALEATRALADKLAEGARSTLMGDRRRLEAIAASDVESPMLSIAIPSFNRPNALADLLVSIADEVAACPAGLIEVCISDDASPDPQTIETALAFAERHRFASLRIRASNIGLERNVLAAGEQCRGEFLMLVGNDDLLVSGALTAILKDIRDTEAPVLLYGKRRINLDGSPRADVPGSIPVDIPADGTQLFDSLVDAAREQGLLSTFGFAGPIVVRRQPFLSVDAEPYLDLTMYSRTSVMIEAFAKEPVFYRNIATILHRTATPMYKHAESLGRLEEEFMSGGRVRLARYFGTSLAATMQRLIDRGALDHETVATMPERLMTDIPLVVWIARNRKIDPTVDARLAAAVVADADRFFTAQADLTSRQVQ